MSEHDVIVVGAGNAAFSAAMAAREKGASVVMLERAPEEEAGGNSRFTAGAFRVVYNGLDDVAELVPDLTEEERATTDFGSYTSDDYFDSIGTLTEYRADPDMAETLVHQSFPTMKWMRDKGVRFAPMYGRQAFKIDGRFKFWGGLTVEAWGGGPGLIENWTKAAARDGIEILYGTRATALLHDDDGIHGVRVKRDGKTQEMRGKAVVLAAGGFEANAEWRTRYLGPGWDLAKVRGSRFNTGDGIAMALEAGAMPWGNWSGCHAVAWDRNAPPFGDLAVGDNFQKHCYPFGIMVNAKGERFVDEGADFRNYTYAKYGRMILEQPGQFCWQVFDDKVTRLFRDEYRIREVTKVQAETLEELAEKLDDVDGQAFLRMVREYNDAVDTETTFNPAIKDGRGTSGVQPPKTNWANKLDTPPYQAFAVTCGLTFTFGGVRITSEGQVLDGEERPMPGLYAAGELVGGLFYFNYPGGTGLMSGAVFGRIAGSSAATAVTNA